MKVSKHGDYETIAKFPVFSNFKIHIVFTGDMEHAQKVRYGSSAHTHDTEAMFRASDKNDAHMFFWLGAACSGTIAHESYHAIRFLMDDYAGATMMDNEVMAYHIGYLVQKITDFKCKLIDAGVE